jgi:hypothetical protein
MRQKPQRCIELLLSEPIEEWDRREGKNLEITLKTMVQAIDAERVWGCHIRRRPRILSRTYREKNLLYPPKL